MSEFITPAEYARSRNLNKSTVSRQIRNGAIPTTADGLIDPLAADRSRDYYLNPKRRKKTSVVAGTPAGMSGEWVRGAEAMATRVVRSAREGWLLFISDLNLADSPLSLGDQVSLRALLAATGMYLPEAWVKEWVDFGSLPAPDWGLFGPNAEVISREAKLLIAEWRLRDGNLDQKPRKKTPTVAAGVPSEAVSKDWVRGAEAMATRVVRSARAAWPSFAADLKLDLSVSDKVSLRVLIAAMGLYLTEAWIEDWVDFGSLPEVDWSAFGEDAEVISREARLLMGEWSAYRREHRA